MKKPIIGVLVLALLGIGYFFFFSGPEFKTYENSRYNFSVDYPSNWELGEVPINNDGMYFTSPRKDITCRAYGFQNVLMNDQGEYQSLEVFIDWLLDDGISTEIERSETVLSNNLASHLVVAQGEIVNNAVYAVGNESGRALICWFSSLDEKEKFDPTFSKMIKSFVINDDLDEDIIFGGQECSLLLSDAIVPLEDRQTFIDTNYTEVSMTSRNSWDMDRIPDQVIDLESKGYQCFPMPFEFDYSEGEESVLSQPVVKSIEWSCELNYREYEYLSSLENKKDGYTCEEMACIGNDNQQDSIYLCYINAPSPVGIVNFYMNYTLGKLSNAEINYDKAKELLTPDFAEEFQDSSFVPSSYCIQDGPDKVRITSDDYDSEYNWTEVIVDGGFTVLGNNQAAEWTELWKFIIVEIEGGDYMINDIICL